MALFHRLRTSNRLAIVCLVAAFALAAAGFSSLARGLAEQRSVGYTGNLGDIPAVRSEPPEGPFLSFAAPTAIKVPAASITSPLISVGKAADGSIDTPKHPDFDKAAWYHGSPSPGQYGTSVIVGHVDSYESDNGASVFYNLQKLRPGDVIDITRADNTTAAFTVYAIREYGRQDMPSDQVYGVNTGSAELRLITCSGDFDDSKGEYTNNTVVYASLTSSHPSS